jgi:hypothetical protein
MAAEEDRLLCDPPDDLLCPVCLDLYHHPHVTDPCSHVFCDPCLRRLAKKDPFNCPCPLCRRHIWLCQPHQDLSATIQTRYSQQHMARARLETATTIYQQPLPWRPSVRNCLKGRPLGGNRLIPLQSEYIRSCLHKLPHMLPPLAVAALVNTGIFTFMINCVEMMPWLLALLFRSLGATGPFTNSSQTTYTPHLGSMTTTDMMMSELANSAMYDIEPSTADTTFYYILCLLTVATAAAGQLFLNHDLRLRVSDLIMVLVVACVPLTLGHVLQGWWSHNSSTGSVFEGSKDIVDVNGVLQHLALFVFSKMNCATVSLLVVSVWFMYCVDVVY